MSAPIPGYIITGCVPPQLLSSHGQGDGEVGVAGGQVRVGGQVGVGGGEVGFGSGGGHEEGIRGSVVMLWIHATNISCHTPLVHIFTLFFVYPLCNPTHTPSHTLSHSYSHTLSFM